VTASKRVAVGTTALGVAGCAACCVAPVAAVAVSTVFAPVAGAAAVTAVAITLGQRRSGASDRTNARTSIVADTTPRGSTLRGALAALLVLSAALLAFGVAREHATHHEEAKPSSAQAARPHVESGNESGESSEQRASVTGRPLAETAAEGRVLGVDLESWPLVVGLVTVSVILALAVLRFRVRIVLLAVGLVVGVAAVFDLAEIVHQVNDSQGTLAVIAAAVMMVHISALGLVLGLAAAR
jgi:hypothetical protein